MCQAPGVLGLILKIQLICYEIYLNCAHRENSIWKIGRNIEFWCFRENELSTYNSSVSGKLPDFDKGCVKFREEIVFL